MRKRINNYFDFLPRYIKNLIYSYDNTYKELYDKVMNELLENEKKKNNIYRFAFNYNLMQYKSGLASLRFV